VDVVDIALVEDTMTKKAAFTAVPLAIFASLLWIGPSLFAQGTTAPQNPSIEVSQLERNTSTTPPCFEDTYQRHYGILDVLKTR
jgi:hypothetical protein